MEAEKILKELPKALLSWYQFKNNARALFVSGAIPELEVLFDLLADRGLDVVYKNIRECTEITEQFDYIILAGTIEKTMQPIQLLATMKKLLKKDGKLWIATDNRLAVRYFCGDKDMMFNHVLDGLDNYARVSEKRVETAGGHAYAKAELTKMIGDAGFTSYHFFSVMPGLIRPQLLISENYTPNECLDVRIFPQYKSPQTIFLEEEKLYATLIANNMFHQMANGFLIECTIDGQLTEVDQITVQGDRAPEEAVATIIKDKKQVIKRALYKTGNAKIELLLSNTEYLKAHNVPVVDAEIDENAFVMPYVEGQIATEYFRDLLRYDKKRFLEEIQRFKAIIENSSEHISYERVNWRQFEPGWEKRKEDDPNIDKWENLSRGSEEDKKNIGVILARGYIDIVSINCFYCGNDFLFFDQEFYIENLPANAILIRTIDFIYRDCQEMELLYPKEELLKELHLYEHQKTFRRQGNDFLEKLRNEKELSSYHKRTRRNWHTVNENRHRMDYPQEEYEKLFCNIFKGIHNKKLFIFGSGKFADDFIEQFGKIYEISGIVDNNSEKWGMSKNGIKIFSPNELKKLEEPIKVFICIKFFEDVLQQLKEMGIRDISIYNPTLEYELPLKQVYKKEEYIPKKYHVGYVAGVFDLFHIGHLNMFKRAKEQCDYLIVGVVSDEQVIKNKKTSPYIPFEERLEIVRSCKYVDEAVALPAEKSDTEDVYRMYHFDVQFSGSDYENDPDWLAKREYLRQHGAELVFFPYTQSTSSTKLKEKIR